MPFLTVPSLALPNLSRHTPPYLAYLASPCHACHAPSPVIGITAGCPFCLRSDGLSQFGCNLIQRQKDAGQLL